MPITFRDATDTLLFPITHEMLADALGVSISAVRQARLADGAKAHRKPPPDWQEAVASLAETRAMYLDALSRALDSEMRKARRMRER